METALTLATATPDFDLTKLSTEPSEKLILFPEKWGLHPKNLHQKLLGLIHQSENAFIFTFSSDVATAIRLMAKRKEVTAPVTIKFFSKDSVDLFKLYADGGIDKWPSDFFDFQENALMELLLPD